MLGEKNHYYPPEALLRNEETLATIPEHSVALVGLGAGNLGLLMHADVQGEFMALLDRGVSLYDSHPFGAGTLNVSCDANSFGSDFSGLVSPIGALRDVWDDPTVVELHRDEVVSLPEAHAFYTIVGGKVAELVSSHPKSALVHEQISYVVYDPQVDHDSSQRFALYGGEAAQEKKLIGYANKVVFGTGASQELAPYHTLREGQSAYTAENVLAGEGANLIAIYEFLQQDSRNALTVLGSSHAALATIGAFLKYDAMSDKSLFAQHPIKLIAKRAPEIFCENRAEAETIYGEQGKAIREELFAPNGAYARFTGVRAEAKKLYQRITSGAEQRVQAKFSDDEISLWEQSDVAESAVVIQAWGLNTNLVPVFEKQQDGYLSVISQVNEKGNTVVDSGSNLMTSKGSEIGLYGIGIGYPHAQRSAAIDALTGPGESPEMVTAANAYGTVFAKEIFSTL